jgi:hypothetical protein
MLRRNLKRMLRYPSMPVMLVGMPIVFLLLFVYVFGGTLGAGLGGVSGGRAEYVNYVAPAIILMTVTATVQGTAISVTMDMTEGIIVVIPSNSQYRHETFGIVSVEAQHSGCRVIASDDGGLPETDCGGVVLVAPGQRRGARLGHPCGHQQRATLANRQTGRRDEVHR